MAEESTGTDTNLRRKVHRYGLILLIVALCLALWGEVSRILARSALAKETAEAAIPTVLTTTPNRTTLGEELVLPGTVQAYVEAPIYARTSGYLKEWRTDIGAQVTKGQLLAEIDAPEVDQQLSQAQADLATARANESLSNSTNLRWKGLLATESVSKQDADEKAGDAAAKKAAADSAAANVSRLRELESFKRVVAPFGGVITARNTDIGALINAGQSAGTELFRIADMHKLRIYVQVPETYAAVTRPGLEAELRFAEQPKKGFTAKTVRTSNALDPNLRTLQVELELDNANHEVFPGAYAEVHFKLPASAETLRLPANTVLFRAAGLQVATVDGQRHVKLKSIVQGRDFGNTIEILSGLESSEVVILNPSDSLTDGTEVRIASAGKAAS
ncbi:MAG TPA: efflux RND transporter periplasmic adaptor subunit [Micropepsaceae bacterium]|jgi:RND family efflux transporter MFP subunit|nr:efflux RND transporter periplasmic adaptor subunit [Steroidobacteraceae bacterium]HXJ02211.1 efflux RND transporter periplasmic adaptor subunit [Micropepsaceae bacterium]